MNTMQIIKPVIHQTTVSEKHKRGYNTCRKAEFYFSKTSGSNGTYVDVVHIICLIH